MSKTDTDWLIARGNKKYTVSRLRKRKEDAILVEKEHSGICMAGSIFRDLADKREQAGENKDE